MKCIAIIFVSVNFAIAQDITHVDNCKLVEFNLCRNSLKQMIFWEQRFRPLELSIAMSEMWYCNYTKVASFPYLECKDYRIIYNEDDIIIEYVGEGKHQVIWIDQDGTINKVYCYHVIWTQTKNDPEIDRRKKLAENKRNKLFKPKVD